MHPRARLGIPVAGLLLALTASAASAQQGGRVPVREVAGRLLFECDVSTPERRIPVNLFLDLDTLCGLQLHNKAAAPLGAESADGQPTPITVHFPDFRLTVPKREHGDEDYLDDFTKYHAAEMGENAVVGTLGAEVLRDWHLVFDLVAGYVEFSPAHARSAEPPPALPGSVVVQATVRDELVWLPVRDEEGRQSAMALGGSRFDTVVDRDWAEQHGAPAGDVGALTVGPFDLAQFVAFRPEEVIQVHPDGVFGVAGINLFRHFRVEIDRVNRWVRLTPTRPPDFPADDLAFFRARADEDADALEAFLDRYPQARLGIEAADLLLQFRLDDGAPADDVHRALRRAHEVFPADLRATAALDRMKVLAEDGWPEYLVYAGELGLESGREDRYPEAVHKIHAKLGEVHLDADDLEGAWKHLLSGAFGMPEDGMVNLNLGRLYEKQGRWRRAFSRYVQAAIVAESGPQAIAGLQRVQPQMPDGERFSVDLIERMIEGKVMNFGAAARYEPDPESATNRVVLVEFFTNANFETFAIGGALGNEGLISHFRDGHAAFLSYHLKEPGLDPLVNAYGLEIAAQRGVDAPTVHVLDGTRFGPGAARARQREAVFRNLKSTAYQELAKPSDWDLAIEDLQVDGQVVRGKVVVTPARPQADPASLRLNVVLAERGVLFPGASLVVIHRNLARAALTAKTMGEPLKLQDGRMEYAFEADLDAIAAANESWLDAQIAAGAGQTSKMSLEIDPGQVSIVAYLRDPWSGRVEQAVQRDHEPQEQP